MYIHGSSVPENKTAFLALQAIYGVGKKAALAICSLVGISPQIRLRELNSAQYDLLSKSCRRLISTNRKRDYVESIKAQIKISSYRGRRKLAALPCRGQRTRTNARTAKKLFAKDRESYK